jgi:thiol:disulfide interchange protein
MADFGMTIAVPFVLLSLFPAKVRSLPRAGEWMHSLKVSLGFLELAAALKFFSNTDVVWKWHVLPRELFFVIWCGIFAVLGLYLLGLFRLKGEEAHGIGGVRMLFGLASIILALYFFHGSQGNRLDWLSEILTAPYSAKKEKVGWTIIEDDLDAALARAKAEGKRAFINFTGIT